VKRLCALCLVLLILVPALVAAQDQNITVTLHVVQRGESLYQIAQAYETTWEVLARLNGLTQPDSIDVGQRLLVPASPDAAGAQTVHVVQPGETLQSIAQFFGVSESQLAADNLIVDGSIFVGQALSIPAASVEVAAQFPGSVLNASAEAVVHTVASGETMYRIATAYGTSVNVIASTNGITDPSVIYPGQRLIIPGVTPPQITASLPPSLAGVDVQPLVFLEGQTGSFRFALSGPAVITGSFLGQSFMALPSASPGTVVVRVGVPIGTPGGIYPAEFLIQPEGGTASAITANIQIVSGGYTAADDILVIGDSTLLFDPAVEEAELNVLRTTMANVTSEVFFSGPFGLPAAATITSGFGNVRSYNNGEVTRVHTGTDFGGAPGTPILAPAAGRVVMVSTLAIRGLATIIDHGEGVYTGYWHQSEAYVSPGDIVQPGQVIGAIGASGRVSGPHLHWELWVNGVPVDPMQWTVQAF
jgi:murein DD-endopeptidase MepM/ murein hydrolase activator NlpD